MSVRLALPFASALAALALPLAAYAAPTCTLIANPASVLPGQGFTLMLSSVGATAATIDNGIGPIGPNSSRQSISIAATTRYTATVSDASGSATCTATVSVTSGDRGTDAGGAPAGGGDSGGGGGGDAMKALGDIAKALGSLGQLQNAFGGNDAQNLMCQPSIDAVCGCGLSMVNGKCQNTGDKWNCPCQNSTNGFTSAGICQAGKCLGQTSGGGQGQLGGGQQGLGQGLQALSSILQAVQGLMGGGGGGGGGSGAGAGGSYAYPSGCAQYYYTTTVSNDPCAIYQPNLVSGALYTDVTDSNPLSSILDSTGTGSDTTQNPISSILTNTNTNTNSNTSSLLNSISGGDQQSPTSSENSLTGDVNDATVLANLRRGFSEIAGFFGGDTLSRVCQTRPWSGDSFLAGIAPDTFFDELCKKAGYQESFGGGAAQPESTTFTTDAPPMPVADSPDGPYIPPEAEIRALPASVRLGTRTYIYWTSQGVDACSVTGPSFTQNTLYGTGATVPITGPTTFTISCTAPDGTVVSDSTTVNLAI